MPYRLLKNDLFLAVALTLATMMVPGSALAQDTAPPTQSAPITAEDVDVRQKAVANFGGIEDAEKEKLAGQFETAAKSLKAAATWLEKKAEWQAMIDQPDQQVAKLKSQLETAEQSIRSPVDENSKLPLVEASVEKLQRDQTQLQNELLNSSAEANRRTERQVANPKEIADLTQQATDLQTELGALPAAIDANPTQLARRTEIEAKLVEIQAQLDAEKIELTAYEASSEAQGLRKELATKKNAFLKKELERVRQLATKKREAEAKMQLEAAKDELEEAKKEHTEASPAITQFLELNTKLLEVRTKLLDVLKSREEEVAAMKTRLDNLRALKQQTENKAALDLPPDAIGVMLREARAQLTEERQFQVELQNLNEERKTLQLNLIDVRDAAKDLLVLKSDVEAGVIEPSVFMEGAGRIRLRLSRSLNRLAQMNDAFAFARMEAHDSTLRTPDLNDPEIVKRIAAAYESRLTIVDDYAAATKKLFDKTIEFEEDEQQLASLTHDFKNFIDERILWIRSPNTVDWEEFQQMWRTASWFLSPANWNSLINLALAQFKQSPYGFLFTAIFFGALLFYKRRMRHRLNDIGSELAWKRLSPLRMTTEALILTTLTAMIWPLVFLSIGYFLSLLRTESAFAAALSAGLYATTFVLFPLEMLRQLARPNGVMSAHFRVPDEVTKVIRWTSGTLKYLLPLAAGVNAAAEEHSGSAVDDPLARAVFIVSIALVTFVLWRALGSQSAPRKWIMENYSSGVFRYLAPMLFLLFIATPVALAVAAMWGYYYGAVRIAETLNSTLYLVIAIGVGQGFLFRWIMLKRTLLLRERLKAQLQKSEKETLSSEVAVAAQETPELDPSIIGEQTRHLVKVMFGGILLVGLAIIWQDVLPAMRSLGRTTIYPLIEFGESADAAVAPSAIATAPTAPPAGDASGDPGSTAPAPALSLQPAPPASTTSTEYRLTLGALALACLAGFTTFVLARNLPGVLELFVLPRLDLDAGGRFAVSTIFQYLVVAIGVIITAGWLGLQWDKIQWLVAAMSVGLGFGLQEIFANFIAGLILLIERPIRIGDIVTIEGVTGTIARIQIRSTTILNWDRQEFIVPNKEFITGRVLNWTLSSTLNRIEIPIGIAYGSDTRKAEATLREIVANHPYVLKDPEPLVTFSGFGDSSLSFVVRVYLANFEHRLDTIHSLHQQIDDAFREANIEIAFPQTDLHIRSAPEELTQAWKNSLRPANGSGNGNGNGNGKHMEGPHSPTSSSTSPTENGGKTN
ncbi:mechanosensitive ion channel [Blastopirellula sp. JC732]|uniref:Mechanosensitive ion channel n=1 Tax=Blastopirellula sediminis TaxID=2894196 RepID=A0A9X1SMY6_9BACT|nr:mechanosensitive ion channel domain-containing protein [Blastopirellula sediminis]MCC9604542.1 mechanosensitive ion channel [Blastopirellula sediminis]MCC9632159.1 mechanosensitive ion channel [Blastopirellula sediminis]